MREYGGVNLYVFTGNSPVDQVDWLGLKRVPFLLMKFYRGKYEFSLLDVLLGRIEKPWFWEKTEKAWDYYNTWNDLKGVAYDGATLTIDESDCYVIKKVVVHWKLQWIKNTSSNPYNLDLDIHYYRSQELIWGPPPAPNPPPFIAP